MDKESRMGIAMLTFGGLLAPLRSLTAWLGQAPKELRGTERRHASAAHFAAPRVCSARPLPSTSYRDRPRRPLRVVRVMEASRTPAGAGRMVISGRMADVCAELDRLAALEAPAR
jgi:hypothetical protein